MYISRYKSTRYQCKNHSNYWW